MSKDVSENRDIEERVVDVFKRVLSQLPANTAELETKRVGRQDEGILVALKPSNPQAASVWAHAENGFSLVDFGFGDWGPTWELPSEGYNPKANKNELLQEVEDLCMAVISGQCSHRRGFLSITGSIHVANQQYRITDLLVFRAKPPLRRTRVYQPYIPR